MKDLGLKHALDKAKEPLRAIDISNALAGDEEQKKNETLSLIITIKHGERPQVEFGGSWNGHFMRVAQNTIARAYRHRKYKQVRPNAQGEKEKAS